MSLFSPIMCALGWHEPKRRDVKWDGRNYRGECRHCGTEIIRISRKTWRKPKEPADA
jgi:hypothetical protein